MVVTHPFLHIMHAVSVWLSFAHFAKNTVFDDKMYCHEVRRVTWGIIVFGPVPPLPPGMHGLSNIPGKPLKGKAHVATEVVKILHCPR